jgi:hypothetical protein
MSFGQAIVAIVPALRRAGQGHTPDRKKHHGIV